MQKIRKEHSGHALSARPTKRREALSAPSEAGPVVPGAEPHSSHRNVHLVLLSNIAPLSRLLADGCQKHGGPPGKPHCLITSLINGIQSVREHGGQFRSKEFQARLAERSWLVTDLTQRIDNYDALEGKMRPDKTKQCGVCKEIVPAKAIGKHINERHFPEVKWNCHYCQKDFPNRESANSHISHASCIFNATVSAVVDGYIQPAATWRTVKAHWAVAELYRVTADGSVICNVPDCGQSTDTSKKGATSIIIQHILRDHYRLLDNCHGYACWRCKRRFNDFYTLRDHLARPACQPQMFQLENLFASPDFDVVRQHLAEEPIRTTELGIVVYQYACRLCDRVSGGPYGLMVHIAEDHLDLVMHCPARDTVHCTFVSPYANVIRDHFARKHVVDASNDAALSVACPEDVTQCSICAETFNDAMTRYRHQIDDHVNRYRTPGNLIECLEPLTAAFYAGRIDHVNAFLKEVISVHFPAVEHDAQRILNLNNALIYSSNKRLVTINWLTSLVATVGAVIQFQSTIPTGPPIQPAPNMRIVPANISGHLDATCLPPAEDLIGWYRTQLVRVSDQEPAASVVVMLDRHSMFSGDMHAIQRLTNAAGHPPVFIWAVPGDHRSRTTHIQPQYSEFLYRQLEKTIRLKLGPLYDQATRYDIYQALTASLDEMVGRLPPASTERGYLTLDYKVVTAKQMQRAMGRIAYAALPATRTTY